MVSRWFCHLGWHWLKDHKYNFTDCVSNESVYDATCSCGITWMTDSPFALLGMRIEKYGNEE